MKNIYKCNKCGKVCNGRCIINPGMIVKQNNLQTLSCRICGKNYFGSHVCMSRCNRCNQNYTGSHFCTKK